MALRTGRVAGTARAPAAGQSRYSDDAPREARRSCLPLRAAMPRRETPVCRAVCTRARRPAPRRGLLVVQRKIEARASALSSVLLRCCQVSGFVPCVSFPTNEFSRAAARRYCSFQVTLPPSLDIYVSLRRGRAVHLCYTRSFHSRNCTFDWVFQATIWLGTRVFPPSIPRVESVSPRAAIG